MIYIFRPASKNAVTVYCQEEMCPVGKKNSTWFSQLHRTQFLFTNFHLSYNYKQGCQLLPEHDLYFTALWPYGKCSPCFYCYSSRIYLCISYQLVLKVQLKYHHLCWCSDDSVICILMVFGHFLMAHVAYPIVFHRLLFFFRQNSHNIKLTILTIFST